MNNIFNNNNNYYYFLNIIQDLCYNVYQVFFTDTSLSGPLIIIIIMYHLEITPESYKVINIIYKFHSSSINK